MTKVVELKPNTYACHACESIFKYVDPTRTEVAPQFCQEGYGNPIKYKCTLCGKMVCEGNGEKAKVLLSRWAFTDQPQQQYLSKTQVTELQQAWCLECFNNMSDSDKTKNVALILKDADINVRLNAVRALGQIGGPSAVPYYPLLTENLQE